MLLFWNLWVLKFFYVEEEILSSDQKKEKKRKVIGFSLDPEDSLKTKTKQNKVVIFSHKIWFRDPVCYIEHLGEERCSLPQLCDEQVCNKISNSSVKNKPINKKKLSQLIEIVQEESFWHRQDFSQF